MRHDRPVLRDKDGTMRRPHLLILAFAFSSVPAFGESLTGVIEAEAAFNANYTSECIDRWAANSKSSVPIDLEQYGDRYGEQYPAGVLKTAAAFFGPVNRSGLERAFRWTVVEVTDGEVRLQGTPRKLERPAAFPTPGGSSSDVTPVAYISQGETVRGDFDNDACSFDVIIDRFDGRPRLVRWHRASQDEVREGIERLSSEDLTLEEGIGDGRSLLSDHSREVITASAMLIEGDAGSNDPAVTEVLSRWEQSVSDLKSVELKFKRFDRDPVFELETRGVGRFVFVAPDRGLYELKPASVVERADAPISANGGKYSVNAAKPQLYWWTGKTVTIVDDREKTFDELTIPKCARGCQMQTVGSFDVIWQVLAGPQKAVPGVVEIRSEKLVNRFQWSIVEKTDTRIMLEGRPKVMSDRRHLSRLDVILDPKSFRTAATRVVDPAGSRTTDHVFEYVRVNVSELDDESLWKPDLSGMSPVGPPPAAPPADELPTAPPPQE
jgi:hypothetical protein